MKLTNIQFLLVYGYIGLLVVIIGGSMLISRSSTTTTAQNAPEAARQEITLALRAKAALLYDISTDTTVYSHNSETQLPIASLTKLMTALTAELTTGADGTIRITKEALREDGDTGLRKDERWKLSDLVDLTLVASSNDGAAAIAEAKGDSNGFVSDMNSVARGLGLSQTYFLNATGLDLSPQLSGGYSSARDIAKLLTYIVREKPDLIAKTGEVSVSATSRDGIEHTVKNTNKELSSQGAVFASKTGLTDLAGGNLAIAFDAGPARPMVAVILGSTEQGRFDDMQQLVDLAISFSRSGK